MGLVVIAAVACGGGDKSGSGGGGTGGKSAGTGGSSSSGGSTGGDTLDATTTCTELLTAACERLKGCGMVVGQTDASILCLSDCSTVVSSASGACAARATAGETFSKSTVDACVAALGAASCDDACSTGKDPTACADFEKLTSSGSSTSPTCDPACVQ
jgi:hypothetical protein